MIEAHGHTSLRLPPHHADLNPIELIWGQVKDNIARKNKTFKFKDLHCLTTQALNSVTAENWRKCIAHTIRVEDQYIANDGILPEVAPLVIPVDDHDELLYDSSSEEEV